MKTIYIDADACAVKAEVYRVATRYKWHVVVVANHYMQTPRSTLISSVVVSQGADVADDLIVERAEAGDIVVTQDIPLASRVLPAGVLVVGQKGKEFEEQSIGNALASRELSEHLREMGIDSGGPSAMTKKDKSRFLGKLDELIHRVQRKFPAPG
jgi:uncharacterized protein